MYAFTQSRTQLYFSCQLNALAGVEMVVYASLPKPVAAKRVGQGLDVIQVSTSFTDFQIRHKLLFIQVRQWMI